METVDSSDIFAPFDGGVIPSFEDATLALDHIGSWMESWGDLLNDFIAKNPAIQAIITSLHNVWIH